MYNTTAGTEQAMGDINSLFLFLSEILESLAYRKPTGFQRRM